MVGPISAKMRATRIANAPVAARLLTAVSQTSFHQIIGIPHFSPSSSLGYLMFKYVTKKIVLPNIIQYIPRPNTQLTSAYLAGFSSPSFVNCS
jgi:hypothetical protein